MKVSKPTQYDCIFFIVSQSLFQQTTTAEDIQKHYTPTNDGEQHYVVKQVNKVIGGTFGATLVCTDMALCSKIRIWIPGTNCVELNGKSTEEKEKAWKARAVLSSWLDEGKKIEVVIYYPRDKYHRYLGSMYVDRQSVGDMLLKERLAMPSARKQRAGATTK